MRISKISILKSTRSRHLKNLIVILLSGFLFLKLLNKNQLLFLNVIFESCVDQIENLEDFL